MTQRKNAISVKKGNSKDLPRSWTKEKIVSPGLLFHLFRVDKFFINLKNFPGVSAAEPPEFPLS